LLDTAVDDVLTVINRLPSAGLHVNSEVRLIVSVSPKAQGLAQTSTENLGFTRSDV
jgi:hypothetical protein